MIDLFLAACVLISALMFCVAFGVLLADPEQLRHDV